MNLFLRIKRFLGYYLNLKSIYLNFKLLPFHQAIKLPIDCSRKVILRRVKGRATFKGKLFFRGMIEIGYGDVTHIDKHSRTNLDITGEVVFNGPAHIGHGSVIRVEGVLELGDQFRITGRSTIVAMRKISFGNNCMLSWDILIMDSDFHKIFQNDNVINHDQSIEISDNVWIGCRATILKGSFIANNCIVGANSFVSGKYLEPNVILAGQPLRAIKQNISWE